MVPARYAEDIDDARSGSPFDEQTGLCNQLGLELVSSYALALCRRNRTPALLLCLDVLGLDEVEQRLGAQAASSLVSDAAGVLASSFRRADVLARVGPARFVALLVEYTDDAANAVAHVEEAVAARNESGVAASELRLAIGTAVFDPSWPAEIPELIAAAAAAMNDTQAGSASTE